MKNKFPLLNTVLSPSLLNLYEINNSIVVIIDILRATSTITTALYNGAKSIIPVDSVTECIKLGKEMDVITAGERDGQIAEGLQYGNTPAQYTAGFIKGKTLILTTTNGTKLLHMALAANPKEIIIGSFCNISSVCDYLIKQNSNIVLACAAWRNKVNMEDTLFAGAVINRIKDNFTVDCDASQIAETLYLQSKGDFFNFLKNQNASHYHRLMQFGLEDDIRFCLTEDNANQLVLYDQGRLVAG